jgi:hypothetical protein
VFLLICVICNSQVLSWRVDSVWTLNFQNYLKDKKPVSPKKESCNFFIGYDLDMQILSIYTPKKTYNYSCKEFEQVLKKDSSIKEYIIHAHDEDGNTCNLNLQKWENDGQNSKYDGQLQVLYATHGKIYFLLIIDSLPELPQNEWVYIGLSNNKDKFYIRNTYVSKDGEIIKIWFKEVVKYPCVQVHLALGYDC